MDHKHRLDAPNNDKLRTIEQLPDKSELSGLYFTPKKQWEGELVSEEEREKRRSDAIDTISLGIKKRFLAIGLLGILPFALFAGVAAIAIFFSSLIANDRNAAVLVVPTMFLFLIWVFVAFRLLRHYFAIFYNHAMKGTVFLFFQLILTGLSAQTFYLLAIAPFGVDIIINTLIIAGFALAWSPIVSFILLHIWVSPRLTGSKKLSLIGLFAIGMASGSLITLLT